MAWSGMTKHVWRKDLREFERNDQGVTGEVCVCTCGAVYSVQQYDSTKDTTVDMMDIGDVRVCNASCGEGVDIQIVRVVLFL